MAAAGIEFTTAGSATTYAPRATGEVVDCHGRSWPLADLQVDLHIAAKLGLHFDGRRRERPVVLHRSVLGSIERFVALLLEHYDRRLPAWLTPVQVTVLAITEKHEAAADRLAQHLCLYGVRAESPPAVRRYTARRAQAAASGVPFIVTLGDRELAGHFVTVDAAPGRAEVTVPTLLATVTEACAPPPPGLGAEGRAEGIFDADVR